MCFPKTFFLSLLVFNYFNYYIDMGKNICYYIVKGDGIL